jgi:hypothetical protein
LDKAVHANAGISLRAAINTSITKNIFIICIPLLTLRMAARKSVWNFYDDITTPLAVTEAIHDPTIYDPLHRRSPALDQSHNQGERFLQR